MGDEMRDTETPDQELPGMWEHADFIGGEADTLEEPRAMNFRDLSDEEVAELAERIRRERPQIIAVSQDGIQAWSNGVREYFKQHPTHGPNCIAMDQFARDLQRMLNIPARPRVDSSRAYEAWLQSPDGKARNAIRHILGMIQRGL